MIDLLSNSTDGHSVVAAAAPSDDQLINGLFIEEIFSTRPSARMQRREREREQRLS
jgi:hypothetical protein